MKNFQKHRSRRHFCASAEEFSSKEAVNDYCWLLHSPDNVDGDALKVVNINVALVSRRKPIVTFPEQVHFLSKLVFKRIVNKLYLRQWTRLPGKLLKLLDSQLVRSLVTV